VVTAGLLTNCSNTLRNIHTNAKENITRTLAKQMAGYFFVAHLVCVCMCVCASTCARWLVLIINNKKIYGMNVKLKESVCFKCILLVVFPVLFICAGNWHLN
jgi:uncharacterized membrane protein